VQEPSVDDHELGVSLAELSSLVKGLGIVPCGRLVQRRPDTHSQLLFGSGKLEELRGLLDRERNEAGELPLVIFDGELSPGQQRHLMSELDAEVFDRTEVILRVFARRARSRTAKLEVELARLTYEAPRARDDSSLDRQEGGGGRGGRGNTNLTLRKQQMRRRIADLRRELERESEQGQTRRTRREGTPLATLVGYTNAGKSSLMRALTGSDAYVENELFATLGTTVRSLSSKGPPVLVADTVGFIRNLPNHLLASFRTTLDEALDADLLLHVVDASDPEHAAQLEVTRQVLNEVGGSDIPAMVVLNKMDRLDAAARAELEGRYPDACFVSALSTEDAERLAEQVVRCIEAHYAIGTLEVPFSAGQLLGDVHARGRVLSQTYTGDGAVLQVRAHSRLIEIWQHQLRAGARLPAAPGDGVDNSTTGGAL
jgi:GTP-binding protein HflX